MGLLNASGFVGIVSYYRLVWVCGRFGGHKTSLCYQVAKTFLEQGYRLVSNNASIWRDDMDNVKLDENGHLHCVVILDEGGLEFKASKQIEMIAAYAAKMDVIYMIPSFFPPTRSAQVLTVQPLFALKSAGLPAVVYRWRVRLAGFEDKGNFIWWYPDEIYGIYSRQDPGAKTGKIVEWLITRTQEYRSRFYGNDDSIPTVEGYSEQDLLADATASMAEAADTLAAVPLRIRGRKRF